MVSLCSTSWQINQLLLFQVQRVSTRLSYRHSDRAGKTASPHSSVLVHGSTILSLFPSQEFCRIYAQFFPFGDPEPLASLVFRGFGVRGEGGGGVVGFHQFITALSAATRGSTEERLACELKSRFEQEIMFFPLIPSYKVAQSEQFLKT